MVQSFIRQATVVGARGALLLSALLPFPAAGQTGFVPPKYEVRAVWLTTTAGLDWPQSSDRAEQKAALREIVSTLQAAHFNTIFFQVRARGDAYYHSTFEPWAENLTGTLGKDPGWDPLAFLIAEAHAAGIEVHAWFNVFKIRGSAPVAATVPPHPSRAFSQWTFTQGGELWLDPGVPEVRAYLLKVAMEIVRNYDIDGLNLDYCRYPGRDFPDNETYRRYGNDMPRDEWRRANVTAFVSALYDAATSLKPMLKIGSSPLGVYNGEAESGSSGSYSGQYQDSKGWLKLGKQDYVAPQIYWTIGNSHGNPDFAALVHSWQHDAAGKQVYAGIGAYKSDVLREIGAQVDSARAAGLSGEAFFRYEFIRTRGTLGDHFQTRALIPPMPWKDNVPPRAPSFLAASEIATNVFELEWTPPPQADDGDLARSYNVYRSVSPHIPFDDPRIIVAEVPGTTNSFIDTVRVPAGVTYYYAVRAVDKGNNEGPPSVTSNATVQELLALRGKMTDVTSLTTSVANGAGTPGLVAYRLARRTPVSLQVFRQGPGGSDSLFTTIVNRLQDGGTYVVGLGRLAFRPGVYTLRLTAGDTVLEQPLNIRP